MRELLYNFLIFLLFTVAVAEWDKTRLEGIISQVFRVCASTENEPIAELRVLCRTLEKRHNYNEWQGVRLLECVLDGPALSANQEELAWMIATLKDAKVLMKEVSPTQYSSSRVAEASVDVIQRLLNFAENNQYVDMDAENEIFLNLQYFVHITEEFIGSTTPSTNDAVDGQVQPGTGESLDRHKSSDADDKKVESSNNPPPTGWMSRIFSRFY